MKAIGTILMVMIGFCFNAKVDQKMQSDVLNRKTVGTIKDAKGIVEQTDDKDVYVITCKEKHFMLNAINLSEKFKQDGVQVIFSGNIKLTNTLEDDWGDLFEVTNMHS